jgi:hypothetical protein
MTLLAAGAAVTGILRGSVVLLTRSTYPMARRPAAGLPAIRVSASPPPRTEGLRRHPKEEGWLNSQAFGQSFSLIRQEDEFGNPELALEALNSFQAGNGHWALRAV